MRSMLLVQAVVVGLAFLLGSPLALGDAPESPEMAARREEMKRRTRRIIYNNDGCDIYPSAANTRAGFPAQRMHAVPDSQVDSVFYCTGATVDSQPSSPSGSLSPSRR